MINKNPRCKFLLVRTLTFVAIIITIRLFISPRPSNAQGYCGWPPFQGTISVNAKRCVYQFGGTYICDNNGSWACNSTHGCSGSSSSKNDSGTITCAYVGNSSSCNYTANAGGSDASTYNACDISADEKSCTTTRQQETGSCWVNPTPTPTPTPVAGCGTCNEYSSPNNCANTCTGIACGRCANPPNNDCAWGSKDCGGGPTPTPTPIPAPTCSGVTFPACITSGASFTVTANGVNNATQVKFPTWSSANGQDDLVWYTDSNGAPWKKNIPQSSHPGGDINVHVYMDNAGYTNVWCDGRNNIPLCCANTAPAGLALTSPTNGVTVDPPVILDWSLTGWGNNCAGPDKQYKVYLDTNPSPTTLLGGPIIITDDSTSFSRTYSSGTPGTTYYWKVAATNDGWATSTETAPRSFTLTTPLPVWFQVVGGDVVAAGGSITSLVPANQSFLTGVKSAVISSGWVSVGTDTANLWKIENTAISPTVMSKNSYAKFRIRVTNRIVPHPTSNLNGLDGLCSISNQAADGACYFITSGPSEITLPGQTISQKIVLLVDGPTQNLKIAGNIDTAGGGLLVVLARNNITLAGPVSILQGIYLADKIFDTGPSTDTALTVTGTVVGLGGVSLSRDVPSDSIPAEKFVFSPEYISALPAGLWEQNRYSQELAP